MQGNQIFLRILHSSLMRVIRREFGRITNSWVLIFVTILGPAFSFLLVAWMFSSAVVRDLPVTVVDMDQTQLSRKISRMVDATPAVNIAFKSSFSSIIPRLSLKRFNSWHFVPA